MREIALDTETTGLDPKSGHRVVEIGCVELINHISTGQTYHVYLNPERPMPDEAFRVHGLSDEFLSDKALFADVADEFLAFLGDARLIIHNAAFDMGFINAELIRSGRPALAMDRTLDTVQLARQKFPGSQANLDALCRRFNIDLGGRDLHGALIDAQLLADVYLELVGGRQTALGLAEEVPGTLSEPRAAAPDGTAQRRREPRPHAPTEAELARFNAFIDRLNEPIWRS